jgi:hypothetical protein
MAMPPRRLDPSAFAGCLLAAMLAAGTADAQQTIPFLAPDGTRFLLAPDPTAVAVHWAIASPGDAAHDPAGNEGLAATLVRSSLLGTWRTGSRDAAREREAVMWLDEAWQRMLRDTGDTVAIEDVKRWDEQARELADAPAFARRVAAAPAWRLHAQELGAANVVTLATTRSAIGAVASLLVERREDCAMRDLPRAWLRTLQEQTRANAAESLRAVRAELVALALPGTDAARATSTPGPGLPPRDVAAATWASTQHPTATVHVLIGDFDVDETRAALARAFTTTQLPPTTRPAAPAPQPLAGMRRSTVRGVASPAVAIAWPLPPLDDDAALSAACDWLADGPNGFLTRRLRQARGDGCRVSVAAPWPALVGEPTLLVVEVVDPRNRTGLVDDVLAACAAAADTPPTPAEVDDVRRAGVRRWLERNRDPSAQAAALAAHALTWPRQPASAGPPLAPAPTAIHALLRTTLTRAPAIVEGTP